MIINLKRANIFDSQTQLFVNPVNCVGKMGKGLALLFKKTFPFNHAEYLSACRNNRLQPGEVHCVQDRQYARGIATPVWIANFPTKHDWRNPSQLWWIEEGLESLKEFMRERKIATAAIPALGCGLGGLDFITEVKPLIDSAFGSSEEFKIELYWPLD